jgi:hypothetical protein
VTEQHRIAVPVRWSLFVAFAIIGAVACALLADDPGRAVASYLAGMAVAALLFEISAFNIRYATRYLPRLTMAAALFSYAISAIALAVLLAASSPRVVNGGAIAAGLVCAVVIWVGTELMMVRVRSSAP